MNFYDLPPRPAPSFPFHRFTAGHPERETRVKEGLSPASPVPCETMKRETLAYHVLSDPSSFHDPFHDRLSVVRSSLLCFIFHFTFYSPQKSLFGRFTLRFCSFLVSRVYERKAKRKGGEGAAGQWGSLGQWEWACLLPPFRGHFPLRRQKYTTSCRIILVRRFYVLLMRR